LIVLKKYIWLFATCKKHTSIPESNADWKWNDGKKIFQASRSEKQARITILISNKANVKPKLIRRDKEYHFISQAQKDKGCMFSLIQIQAILWKTGYAKRKSLTGEGE
jgi:hypothetical protein